MVPRSLARGALALALAALAGCAAIPRAPKERDAEVKTFLAAPDKANVYVFRDQDLGKLLSLTVLLDGKLLGNTQGHTFLFTQVAPGPHKLESQGENDVEITFTAEAGKNVFVWQEVRMALLKALARLQVVDEARGQQGVQACQLVLPVRLD